jgi:hypothetical protein
MNSMWGALIQHMSMPPQPLVFIDGPTQYNHHSVLDNRYDYLCTSGGFPLPSEGDMLFYVPGCWMPGPSKK